MRSPSDKLLHLLSELQLCDIKEVSACEPTVRLLCRDLPDFDSVWIDALAQRRVLTPWQADILNSSDPHRLRVGRYVLTRQLGNSTFLGRELDSYNTVAVRRLSAADSKSTVACARTMEALVQRAEQAGVSGPDTISLPLTVTESKPSAPASVVSEFVPGWNADELLIRGGRIPWPVVAEIGRQLLNAITWLESQELHHGEIVLRNVRVRPDGKAVLVAPFVARQQQPFTSFTESVTLRDIETIAPELIATGCSPDSRSEIYAVGCVLWQLLTSRPVFPSADPVARLSQAKAGDVDNVRDLVPDCPDWMARAIHNFTRRSPELRSQSLGEASEHWTSNAGVGCRATRNLCQRLPDCQQISQLTTSAKPGASGIRGIGTVTAAIVMVCGFISFGVHRGLLPSPLILSRGNTTVDAERPAAASAESPSVLLANGIQPDADGTYTMPQPDAAGVVVLQSNRSYRAADLSFAGVMHIETSSDVPASVVVEPDSPWRVEAAQVIIDNVQLFVNRTEGSALDRQAALITTCDVLSMTGCVINMPTSTHAGSCMYWVAATEITNVISMNNCVFSGGKYGIRMSTAPDRCSVSNTLFINPGAALRCDLTSASRTAPRLTLSQVTQAEGHSFLDIVSEIPEVSTVEVRIQCGESVLAPRTALVRIALPSGADAQDIRAEFLLPERGNPTVVPPALDPVVYFDRSLNQMVRLAESQIVAESLLMAEPIFRNRSEDMTHFQQFELLDFEGPKLSRKMPGIDSKYLPTVVDRLKTKTQADP
ncbi:MAG: protein kinase [Fuerstiella sp.]|nr:protein kinase [Fuerstiella sp.]